MILHTGDFPLPNLGRCLVGRGLGRGRGVVCHVGRGGRGRRRADRLGVPELLVVAGEVGGVRREGRGRRVLWVVPSPSSPVDPPPLRSEGRCEMDFLVGRTCQEEKLWTDHLDESTRHLVWVADRNGARLLQRVSWRKRMPTAGVGRTTLWRNVRLCCCAVSVFLYLAVVLENETEAWSVLFWSL